MSEGNLGLGYSLEELILNCKDEYKGRSACSAVLEAISGLVESERKKLNWLYTRVVEDSRTIDEYLTELNSCEEAQRRKIIRNNRVVLNILAFIQTRKGLKAFLESEIENYSNMRKAFENGIGKCEEAYSTIEHILNEHGQEFSIEHKEVINNLLDVFGQLGEIRRRSSNLALMVMNSYIKFYELFYSKYEPDRG